MKSLKLYLELLHGVAWSQPTMLAREVKVLCSLQNGFLILDRA